MLRHTSILAFIILIILSCQACDSEKNPAMSVETYKEPQTAGDYRITVVNATDRAFSVYVDGFFRFDLIPGQTQAFELDEGVYLLEARSDGTVVADERFSVDSNIEWTIY